MKINLVVELGMQRYSKTVDISDEYAGKTVEELINDEEIADMLNEHVWDHVCSYIEIREASHENRS